jgi:hypothetical protein
VFGSGQSFSEEVSKYLVARMVLNGELTLTDAVPEPMETEIDAFGLALFNGVGGQANGEFVVAEDGCGWL